jgi:hypothetical protein
MHACEGQQGQQEKFVRVRMFENTIRPSKGKVVLPKISHRAVRDAVGVVFAIDIR